MNNEDRTKNLVKSVKTGESAASVLENSEFINGFDTIMGEITRELMQVDTSDDKKMISVVTRYQEAAKFKARLTVLVEDGKRDQGTLSKLLNIFKGD